MKFDKPEFVASTALSAPYEADAESLLRMLFKLQPRTSDETDIACAAFNLGVNYALGHPILKTEPVLLTKGE